MQPNMKKNYSSIWNVQKNASAQIQSSQDKKSESLCGMFTALIHSY